MSPSDHQPQDLPVISVSASVGCALVSGKPKCRAQGVQGLGGGSHQGMDKTNCLKRNEKSPEKKRLSSACLCEPTIHTIHAQHNGQRLSQAPASHEMPPENSQSVTNPCRLANDSRTHGRLRYASRDAPSMSHFNPAQFQILIPCLIEFHLLTVSNINPN